MIYRVKFLHILPLKLKESRGWRREITRDYMSEVQEQERVAFADHPTYQIAQMHQRYLEDKYGMHFYIIGPEEE